MKKVAFIITILIFALTTVSAQKTDKPTLNGKEVSFKTKDGVTLYADIYKSAKGNKAPLIMLFHQGGGDARGEYQPLIPRLTKEGYNIIAVDLRTGGNRFGMENRTVAKLGDTKYTYCDAFPDLVATLEYVKSKGFKGKKIAWGSSFSAALVFQLATKHGKDLAGILAFSPASGGPMEPCKPSLYVSDVKIPTLALRPKSEMEMEASQAQFKLFRENNIQTYISENGVHGSSMLNSERVKGNVDTHWETVLNFVKTTFN
jgi:dienelactone hydrolase